MTLAQLPRLRLAHLPTPLDDAPHLSRALEGPRILIKRDDLTGLALGGNKARKLEYLFGAAKAAGATVVLTTAGVNSNYLCMFAAGARRAGLRPRLFLRGTGTEPLQGNLLLDTLVGADLQFIAVTDPWSGEARAIMEEDARALARQGERAHVITIQTTDAPLAAAGYVNAALELYQQLADRGLAATHLFTATSSGITQAGLILGARLLQWPLQVVGIAGTPGSAPAHRQRIADIVERGAALLGLTVRCTPDDVLVEDAAPEESLADVAGAIRLVGACEGVMLDPATNGRAAYHLRQWIAHGRLTAHDTVVLLHTGGVPNLLMQGAQLGAVMQLLDQERGSRVAHRAG